MGDTRTPARKEDSQRRRADVMRLRRTGATFEEIGDRLGITKQAVHKIYTKALAEIPAQEVTEYRAEQADRLDALLVKANEVLARQHITVSNGKVVMLDGRPVPDDGPTLDAIKTVLAIEDRRAKLLGLDTPVKQQLQTDQTITYAFEGIELGNLR